MRTSFLLIFALGVLGYITLSSKMGGVGTINNTEAAGAPGAASTCASCHFGGTFNPTTTIDIKNSSGTSVSQVTADSIYDVTVTIAAGNGTPSTHGFQAIFLSDSANTNIGTFQNLGTGQTTKTFTNGRVAVEHNTPSSSNTFAFKWKAPAYCPGGTATLYAFGLATNGSSSTTGDIADGHTKQVTVVSSTPSALAQTPSNVLDVNLFPNPVVTDLNLSMELKADAEYQLSIFGSNGQKISTQNFNGNAGNNRMTLNVNELAAGTYRIVLQDENGARMSKSFVKF
jgi:hypothetical protein